MITFRQATTMLTPTAGEHGFQQVAQVVVAGEPLGRGLLATREEGSVRSDGTSEAVIAMMGRVHGPWLIPVRPGT